MSTLVCSNKIEIVSIRKRYDRRAVKWVAMLSFRYKLINDGVKAKNKNQWGEWVTLKDTTFHGEVRWGLRSGNGCRELRVEAFDVWLYLRRKVLAGANKVNLVMGNGAKGISEVKPGAVKVRLFFLAWRRREFHTVQCSMQPFIPVRKAFWREWSISLFKVEERLEARMRWKVFPTTDERGVTRKLIGSDVEPDLCIRVILERDQQVGEIPEARIFEKRTTRKWCVHGRLLR